MLRDEEITETLQKQVQGTNRCVYADTSPKTQRQRDRDRETGMEKLLKTF